jgi:hypothetical protein
MCILYVKDISEKFKCVGNRYIRAAFAFENQIGKISATDKTVCLQHSP